MTKVKSKLSSKIRTAFIKIALMLNDQTFPHLPKYLKQRQNQQPKKPNSTLDPALSRHLSLSSREDVKYLNRVKNTYTDGVNRSDAEANSTDRSLSNQLILITTVLITANIVVLGNTELLKSLTRIEKCLLLTGMASLTISLLLGVQYYQIVKKFHKSWATARNNVVNAVIDRKAVAQLEIDAVVDKEMGILKPNIDERVLNYQIRALQFAFFAYFVLVVALLFSFVSITGDWKWNK